MNAAHTWTHDDEVVKQAVVMYRDMMASRRNDQGLWSRWQVMHACSLSVAQNEAFKSILDARVSLAKVQS